MVIMSELADFIKDREMFYRPIPFWSWNDKLEPEELRNQIHWMKENGIGGFFMHARGGLKTPYLSEEWMRCIKICCEEAQKLGMDAWVYDENGWPSGFCGGKLLEDEKNHDCYIRQEIGKYNPDADISYDLEEESLIRVNKGDDKKKYLNLYLCRSVSTVDILNPHVTDQFLKSTHEQYKSYFGDDFAKKLKGFFTDEPQYYRDKTPYTPMIRSYFAQQYQEEIYDRLGLLFVKKKGYRTFRYRYWLGMQRLMLENYAKKIYEWCDKQGVKLTGHYVEEVSMGMQMMCCAGVMPFYEYEHIPGIDWLGKYTENELSVRQLGSVACQLGKKQVLTETFGCCGWDITPGDLKRVAEFQFVNGVNLMCQHLVPYSEHGQRKRDFPAHFATMNPWVKEHFEEFNTYFDRLGCLLGETKEVVNVAMLHPIRSAYLDYQRGQEESGFGISDLDEKLKETCRMLSTRGIAYHFLDETLLEKHGFVKQGKIGCGKCSYTYLILPKMETMGSATEKLIFWFLKQGGKVLLLDEKPSYLEGSSYSYDYLETNCTLQEIADAQPFTVKDIHNRLYYTYHQLEEKAFLFVMNASAEETFSQTFVLGDKIKSFEAVDLLKGKKRKMPLTITVPANGSLLLWPSQEAFCENKCESMQQKKEIFKLQFQDAAVSFENNFLPVDVVRFSLDGINFSKPMLRNQLFDKLLKERYEGKLWVAYDFEIQEVPEKLMLLAEKGDKHEFSVNGRSVYFQKSCEEERALWMADISDYVQKGMNSCSMMLTWHQSQDTYYALFGEDVTESLKNCIAYDSEIESIYLAGKFGVYSHEKFESYDEETVGGSHFYIGAVPESVKEPTMDGLPFFRGKLILSEDVFWKTSNINLDIRGRYLTAKVWVNGNMAEELLFEKQVDVSQYAKEGKNHIEVEFTIGNRNLLGPFHTSRKEEFTYPTMFDAYDLPVSDTGYERYKLYRFYRLDSKTTRS